MMRNLFVRIKRPMLSLGALALLLGGVGQVKADFIFGSTGGFPNFLNVTTTTGSYQLSTGTNKIIPDANNQGWWNTFSGHFAGNDNFFTTSGSGGNYNSFFTFDIEPLAGQTVTGVILNIQHPGSNLISGTGVTYSIYDVSTDPYALSDTSYGPNIGIYNDLGSGKLYGSAFIPGANLSQYFIPLNGNAVSDLQNAINGGRTYFSVGGTMGGTSNDAAVVPEPSSLALLGIAGSTLAGFLGWKRRKQTMRA